MVDVELDKLVEQGISTPVQFLEWALTTYVYIVPILKNFEKNVRICGA